MHATNQIRNLVSDASTFAVSLLVAFSRQGQPLFPGISERVRPPWYVGTIYNLAYARRWRKKRVFELLRQIICLESFSSELTLQVLILNLT